MPSYLPPLPVGTQTLAGYTVIPVLLPLGRWRKVLVLYNPRHGARDAVCVQCSTSGSMGHATRWRTSAFGSGLFAGAGRIFRQAKHAVLRDQPRPPFGVGVAVVQQQQAPLGPEERPVDFTERRCAPRFQPHGLGTPRLRRSIASATAAAVVRWCHPHGRSDGAGAKANISAA